MPFPLDVRTLFLIGAFACLLCGVMLVTSRRLHRASTAGMNWAAAAEFCVGSAMGLIALRGTIPDVASIIVANTLGPAGALCAYECVRRLMQRPAGTRAVAWMIGAIFLVQCLMGTDLDKHGARLILTSVVQGGAALASVPLLARRLAIDPTTPLRWAIGFALVFGLLHVARLVFTATAGVSVGSDGMIAGNPAHVAIIATFTLAPVVFAMAIIALVNGRLAAELRKLATTDELTGLHTRRSFVARASELMDRTRDAGRATALLMLDVDRFKRINDSHGHTIGDRVLAHFAATVRRTVPKGSVVGRYGGEEFCVMLACESIADALSVARRVNAEVRDSPFQDSERTVPLTVSIGLSGPADGDDLRQLLVAADRRVYLAKAMGRDRVIADDPDPLRAPATSTEQVLLGI